MHRVRAAVSGGHDTWDAELSAMAADPQLQPELHRLNALFTAELVEFTAANRAMR